jgi:hypothetical protein
MTRNGTALVLLVALVSVAPRGGAQGSDEPPPRLDASSLLPPEIRQGPHHRVDPVVTTEGYFHRFALSSTFGPFDAIGQSQLAVRVHEIGALAELQKVSKTEVFLAAAGQSVVRIGQSAAAVVTDPAAAAKGMGAGIKRVGVNLGRRTQRAVASVGDDSASADEASDGSAAGALLGVDAAGRRWAQKVGVDPYTTNLVLRQALADIAKVDAAGSIATKVAVPIPQVVGMTSTVGALVWGKDPEELRKINEKSLRELSVPDATSAALAANRWFTLTYQTRLIGALRAVNVAGAADYVRTAADASSDREALFFVESAELLARRHPRQPVTALLTDSRALVAASGGVARALLPLDWIGMSTASSKALRDIGARARQELKARRLEVVTTGRLSDRMQGELAPLGWVLAAEPTGR